MTPTPTRIPGTRPAARYAIDVECLGTDATAVLLSVAAVNIDAVGSTDPDDYFEYVFDPRAQRGRTLDADTVMWWFTQPDATRAAVRKPGTMAHLGVEYGLRTLRDFLANADEVYQWGTLDADILNHALRGAIGGGPHDTYVVHYRKVRDARSIFAHLGAARPDTSGHTALGDACALALAVRRAVPWAAS